MGGGCGGAGEARPRRAVPEPHTYRLAEVTCAGVHALLPLAVAAAPTSVDGHTWRFKKVFVAAPNSFPTSIHTSRGMH